MNKNIINPNAVKEKSWDDFRKSGALWMVNNLLQVFGWSIVIEVDQETDTVINVFPGRVKYRGYTLDTSHKNCIRLAAYMKENADDLLNEALES